MGTNRLLFVYPGLINLHYFAIELPSFEKTTYILDWKNKQCTRTYRDDRACISLMYVAALCVSAWPGSRYNGYEKSVRTCYFDGSRIAKHNFNWRQRRKYQGFCWLTGSSPVWMDHRARKRVREAKSKARPGCCHIIIVNKSTKNWICTWVG